MVILNHVLPATDGHLVMSHNVEPLNMHSVPDEVEYRIRIQDSVNDLTIIRMKNGSILVTGVAGPLLQRLRNVVGADI